MELLLLILLVGLFALWVSNRGLKMRVEALERHIASPPIAVGHEPDPSAGTLAFEAETADALHKVAAPEAIVAPAVAVEAAPEPALAEPAPQAETVGALFERLVAGRLLIWLGGIALVVAAIFLIRYSIEIGLVTPLLRMIAAASFGLILVGLGEAARIGRFTADDPRIGQALVGAGIAVLYAAAYGSHILYGLIGPAAASVAMLAITVAALGLSLRHGAPTAVMGLAGGFLTPLLVGDPDSGTISLLAYLALLDLALFLIAWRRGWTWLAAAATLLSFAWSAYLLFQPREDAIAAGLFVILLALAASLVKPGEGRSLARIQPMILGFVQLTLLVARPDLDSAAWTLFGLLAAASMVLAAFRAEYRLAPPIALALALALLLAKAATKASPLVPDAAIGITALFGIGGLILALRSGKLLWTATASIAFAGPVMILRAARPELLERPAWGALMLLLALGPIALGWRQRGGASIHPPADLALLTAGTFASLLLGAAVWDLLPGEWVAAGWLAVALLAALAARRLGDLAFATVAVIVALVAVARGLATVPELSTAAMTVFTGQPLLAVALPGSRAALFALALPGLLLAAMRFVLPPLGARRALIPAAATLLGAAAYIWFKQAWGLRDEADFAARGFLERMVLTQGLFLFGWMLGSGRIRIPRADPDLTRLAGTALTALGAARLIWFDMIVHNPAWADQWVGDWPVLNLLLPAFLLSAIYLYAARRRADLATRSGFWLAAFLAALIAGALLMVRQAFHGAILTGPEMPIAEFYGYSLASLSISIGLLVAGIRLPDKALRLAGLVLLTATIFKVFLVDASELTGALRILSFLGLGIALIGIGRLYGPVLRAERGTG